MIIFPRFYNSPQTEKTAPKQVASRLSVATQHCIVRNSDYQMARDKNTANKATSK